MPKKSFRDDVAGADKLFSINDAPNTEIMGTDLINDTSVNISSNIKENINADMIYNTTSNLSNNRYYDILDNIKKNEEPSGKTCAIYLSGEVLGAVNAAAKERHVSRSKLINGILKQVLLGEI